MRRSSRRRYWEEQDAYIRRKKMLRMRSQLPLAGVIQIDDLGQGTWDNNFVPSGGTTFIGDVAPVPGIIQLANGAFEWVLTGFRTWTLIQRMFPGQ